MSIWSKGFWKATTERVVIGFASGMLGTLGSSAVNIVEVDFSQSLAIGAGSSLVVLLTAIVGTGTSGSPSPTGVEVPTATVVEKVQGTAVVAGPANTIVKPGNTVRSL